MICARPGKVAAKITIPAITVKQREIMFPTPGSVVALGMAEDFRRCPGLALNRELMPPKGAHTTGSGATGFKRPATAYRFSRSQGSNNQYR